MIRTKDEDSVLKVIQNALAVFRPGQSFSKTVTAFGSAAKVVEDLIKEHDLDIKIFVKMFDAIPEGNRSASASRKRSRSRSGEPKDKEHGKPILAPKTKPGRRLRHP